MNDYQETATIKRLCLLLYVVAFPFCIHAESQSFGFSSFNFFFSSKTLKNGSITDIGLGFMYTDKAEGQLLLRNTKNSKNEEMLNVADSLNAITENTYEIFLLPIEYYFFKTSSFRLWGGAGLYYNYDNLNEKGFFNMPELEAMTPPRERVNSYTNDFSMHLVGPLADAGISYTTEWFKIAFSAGIAPIFYLHSSQKISMIPLLDPHYAEFSQDTWGNPYFYLNIDSILFKYINLVFGYDFIRMNYRVLDFDENLAWITPERAIVTQSFKIEASILLPLGSAMHGQIGYGYTFDSTWLDSTAAVSGNRQYLLLTAKRTGN